MYKLIESDKYDLRMQVCNVAERVNDLSRALASEYQDLDGYQLHAFARLQKDMEELVSMIEHIKSRRKAA